MGVNSVENVYGVIPARGGSKRINKKNITFINGKPLIAYTIESALESGVFKQIIVNSDDDDILKVAAAYGIETYKRPDFLANDTTFVIEVIQEMIKTLRLDEDVSLGIMLATCPLRSSQDIYEAFLLFKKYQKKATIVSVCNYDPPIQLAHYITEENYLQPVFPQEYRLSTRSTDHKTTYRYNEAIIFNSVSNILRQDNLIGKKPIAYIMPPERSIVIDYPYHIKLIELLTKNDIKD